MSPLLRRILQGAGLLAAVGLLAAGTLSVVDRLTAERIAQAEREAQLRALAVVLPQERYDNDPITDSIAVVAPFWLGSDRPLPVRRARLNGQPSVLVLDSIAPDGYSGEIRLIIGIDRDGVITGVRVTGHRETPGLGDRIEAGRSDWITRFAGLSTDSVPEAEWRVRKDGGTFDQFAGATITPRAVVRAVHRTLVFVERNGDQLFAAAPGETLFFGDAPDQFGARK